MFIGECLVRTFDGTWSFEPSPGDSYLEVGTVLLDPFEKARRWVAAEDKDTVFLEEIVDEAKRASRESTSMTIAQDYIDPTKELTEKAIGPKLAEIWATYLFSITDASFSKVAQTITPLEINKKTILFELGPQWAPDYATGPNDAAVNENGRIVVAYLRRSGEFMPMGSTKAVSRLLGTTVRSGPSTARV